MTTASSLPARKDGEVACLAVPQKTGLFVAGDSYARESGFNPATSMRGIVRVSSRRPQPTYMLQVSIAWLVVFHNSQARASVLIHHRAVLEIANTEAQIL